MTEMSEQLALKILRNEKGERLAVPRLVPIQTIAIDAGKFPAVNYSPRVEEILQLVKKGEKYGNTK